MNTHWHKAVLGEVMAANAGMEEVAATLELPKESTHT